MKTTKANQWYLVKADWMVDFEDLTDAEFGQLIRSLYADECPEGSQRVLFKALREEFVRVNEKRTTSLALRKAGSEKANANKAQRALLKSPVEVQRDEKDAHIDNRVYSIEDSSIGNNEYKIEDNEIDYSSLSKKDLSERANLIFQ